MQVDSEDFRKKQQELEDFKKQLLVEQDRKTKDEEVKKTLRKEITTLEESVEEYERNKLNSERNRKKLEGDLEDTKVIIYIHITSPYTIDFGVNFSDRLPQRLNKSSERRLSKLSRAEEVLKERSKRLRLPPLPNLMKRSGSFRYNTNSIY